MLLLHLFVYFVCITLYLLSLPVDVMGWLPLVIVALPQLFIEK